MIRLGDCRDILPQLAAEGVRVNCVVTSPPYWGLRDYGVAGAMGLESTLGEYVQTMVGVFRLVREVLADDGTVWLNMGDCYAGSNGIGRNDVGRNFTGGGGNRLGSGNPGPQGFLVRETGLKPKDLCGVPWRVAFALQADGWYLRQDIIWAKPNPMPESVTDRCTKAHEYVFLLSKRPVYYFDQEAIRENGTGRTTGNLQVKGAGQPGFEIRDGFMKVANVEWHNRNRRSVWTIPSEPYPEAHFATFPKALVEPCILAGCPVGGIVLDPFIGSGTVGQVAENLGRRWIGIELSPAYTELARVRTAQMGMALMP